MKKTTRYIIAVVFLFGLINIAAFAGELNSPAAPADAGSAMFTLEDLYNRLLSGTAGNKRSGAFTEPTAAPGSTMHNLNEIMNKAPIVDALGAVNTQVLTGKKFWGLTSGQWGLQTGTMSNVGAQNLTPGAASQTITAGYHDGTGKVGGDPSLVSGNIKAGTAIFGVAGDANVVNTASGDATSGELMSGKKAWVDGAEVTGTLATKSISNATTTIESGFFNGTTLSAIDTDLTFTNIRAGTTIFGISGNPYVVDTSTGNATAGEILFGRKAWVDGVEVTGTRTGGVVLKAGGNFSDAKRWYDNGDGTITDTTTGLVWIKKVNNTLRYYAATATMDTTWFVYTLQSGVENLSDNSSNGDWRLPTMKELNSLKTGTEAVSASSIPTSSSGPIFTGNLSGVYFWSSTNYSVNIAENMVWSIAFDGASNVPRQKADSATTACVWAVRSML